MWWRVRSLCTDGPVQFGLRVGGSSIDVARNCSESPRYGGQDTIRTESQNQSWAAATGPVPSEFLYDAELWRWEVRLALSLPQQF